MAVATTGYELQLRWKEEKEIWVLYQSKEVQEDTTHYPEQSALTACYFYIVQREINQCHGHWNARQKYTKVGSEGKPYLWTPDVKEPGLLGSKEKIQLTAIMQGKGQCGILHSTVGGL